jgi:hypothetical protein
MNETEYVAFQVVNQLQREFPGLEIQNHRSQIKFEGTTITGLSSARSRKPCPHAM